MSKKKKKLDYFEHDGMNVHFDNIVSLDKNEEGLYDICLETGDNITCNLDKATTSRIHGKLAAKKRYRQDNDVKLSTQSNQENGLDTDVKKTPETDSNLLQRALQEPDEEELYAIDASHHLEILDLLAEPNPELGLTFRWIRPEQAVEYISSGWVPATSEHVKHYRKAKELSEYRPGTYMGDEQGLIMHTNGDLVLYMTNTVRANRQHQSMIDKNTPARQSRNYSEHGFSEVIYT
tara:strand:- start:21496 stop:22200 length:705 start_codon:yes stop_codon:yes gene_type:complete